MSPGRSSAGTDTTPVRVYLIEDNRVLRDSIRTILDAHGFNVVGASGAATEGLKDLERSQPQIVLIDASLADGDGVVARLREAAPQTDTVVMNFPPTHNGLVEFIRAGVAGFILKDATDNEIAGTIRRVAGGAPALPRALSSSLFSHVAAQPRPQERHAANAAAKLTRREREVIGLIADGLSNKEIAAQLHIATHTVKSHMHVILEKLGLRTRLEVAAYAHARSNDPGTRAPAPRNG